MEIQFDIQKFANHIYGTEGNDTLKHTYVNNWSSVIAYGGNDSIYVADCNYVTVDAGAGNDSIKTYYSSNSIFIGGTGDDIVSLTGISNNTTLNYKSGDGDDVVYFNGLSGVPIVNITDGANYYTISSGNDVIVHVGSGSISLKDARNQVTVTGGNYSANAGGNSGGSSGSGTIINNQYSGYQVLNGTDYADVITNYSGNSVTINGGNGNDKLESTDGYYVVILGGAGNDTIKGSHASGSTLLGEDGNDYIFIENNTGGVLFDGGKGSDIISINGGVGSNTIQYAMGDAYDTVYGYSASDIVKITDGSEYSTMTSGNDVIVSINGGVINLKNAVGKTININGGTLIEEEEEAGGSNTLTNIVLYGTDDDDEISNEAGGVTILAGGGDDYIYSSTSYTVSDGYGYVTIDGGAGNDNIDNYDPNVSINGGNGNDFIDVHSWQNVTVKGGKGNDSITELGSNNVIQYAGGDGYDVLFDYQNTDTISITDGSSYVTSTSGSDVIVSIGSGSLTIKNASDKTINIAGGSSNNINTVNNTGNNVKVNGTSGKDYITNSGSGVTIQPGAGDDTVEGSTNGEVYLFSAADGDNVILNFGTNDTLKCTSGSISSVVKVGSNAVVSIRNNSSIATVTLEGAGDYNFIQDGNTLLVNSINSINYITNAMNNVTLTGSSGNDSITNSGSGVTIYGTDGSDTINGASAYGDMFVFDAGLGNALITNFSSNDTLYCNLGTISSLATVGNDVVVIMSMTLRGNSYTNNVTLQGAASLNLKQDSHYLTVGTDDTVGTDNTISNYNNSSFITGTADADYIINHGERVTINGLGGNDTIEDNGARTAFRYRSYEGDDVIYGYDSTDTINITENVEYDTMLSGNDVVISVLNNEITLKDAANKTLNIAGGTYAGDDGDADTDVDADADTDTDADSDDDDDDGTIFNRNSNTAVNGTGEADYIIVGGSSVTVNAGRGNDTIELSGNNEVINYANGDGNDTIDGVSSNTRINITGSAYSTQRSGSNTVIKVGNGQMLLRNYNGALNINGTLEGSNGGRLINNENDNSIVSGTDNPDTINNNGDYVVVNAGKGADRIHGVNNYTTINGGDGNDTITGEHWRSVVNGGAGADLISLDAYWYNTVDGGAGNDSIITGSSKASLNGGANDDFISISGSSLTVKGGAGNDTIRSTGSGGNLYQYNLGDGNDLIEGINAGDTLTISGGYTTLENGKNIVVLMDNGDTIRLNGAKGKAININNAVGNTSTVATNNSTTPQDVILTFMKSLDDSTADSAVVMLDDAIRAASDGKFTNIQDVIDQMIADCTAYNAGDSISGWKRFLLEKCDIDLDNEDTGAISGYDAGGSDSVKTAENIVSENTELDSSFTDSYFNIGNLNVCLGKQTASNTVEKTDYNSLKTEEKKTWQGLQSGWLSNSLSLIGESYGSNFSFGDKSTSTLQENTLYVMFKSVKSSEFASVNQGEMNDNGETKGPLTLTINTYNFPAFKNGKVDDAYVSADDNYVGNSYFFERILTHEFTHAVMDANIKNATGQEGLPQFVKDGLAELTHGADDGRGDEIRIYAQNPTTLLTALDLTRKYQNYPAYAGGYMFFRYIAKQFSSKAQSDNYDVAVQSPSDSYTAPPTGIILANPLLTATTAFKGTSIALTDYAADLNRADATELTKDVAILGTTHNDSLNSGSGADKLYGGDGNDTIIGNRGADTLYGDAGNDLLNGGDGDDYIYGGVGNDTLTGGNGEDFFVYEDGRDVITDYAAGVDKIQLESRFITSATVDGSDVVLYTDGGSLTVRNGKNQMITVIDRDGVETTQIYGRAALSSLNVGEFDGVTLKSSKLTLGTPFTGSVDLANFSSKVKTVDATKTDGAVEIIGNDKANTFKAGSGGSTLNGGGKNDKLYGGDGIDVFVFDGQGKDKVYNYAAGDRIVLTETVTKSKLSGKNLKVTVEGGGVLTVNKIFDVEMTITTADGETNNYIFDKKHKTLEDALNNTAAQFPSDYWFLNNPIEESPLSSIVETDHAVDFDYDQTVEAIKLSTNDLTYSARHRQKK